MTHHPLRGIIYMILSALFFASMGACLKYALVEIPVYEAIFFRSIVSSLIIGLVIQGKRISYLGINRKMLTARSLAGFAAMSCGFFALAHIPLADAAVLHHTTPLFVALFATLFLGERAGAKLILYVMIALLGVVLVIQPQWGVFNLYGMIALLGALFAGLAYVFVRHLHKTDSAWVIAFHFASISALLAIPLMIADFVTPNTAQWMALIGAGLCGTGGQILMTLAYRYDEASLLAPFSYVGVGMSFFYGALFWHEVPNFYTFLGMILIVISGIILARHNLAHRRVVALGEE